MNAKYKSDITKKLKVAKREVNNIEAHIKMHQQIKMLFEDAVTLYTNMLKGKH